MFPKHSNSFLWISLAWIVVGGNILSLPTSNAMLGIDPRIFSLLCQTPPKFPSSIEIFRLTYHNWAEDIVVSGLWTAFPQTANDVLTISNWAAQHNYTVRASGFMHNWSPLTVGTTDSCSSTKVIIVKTANLASMTIISGNPAAVYVQTGASMDNLLAFLETNGYGLYASPAPGDISIGGVLAIGGHGTGIPTNNAEVPPGLTAGSISSLVVSFTAVVWDSTQSQFVLRTFDRSESDAKAFLINLGRTFLTDVTLRVGENYNLRCVSRLDIPATSLFAAPDSSAPNKIEDFLESSGRIETILFPFTANPWLKVWTVSPTQPSTSRAVNSPYNYPVTDNIPTPVALLASQIIQGAYFLAPKFGQLQYTTIVAAMPLMDSADIWGPSKNTLLYIKPTTLRVTANGYAVITARSNVQNVIYEAYQTYENLIQSYQSLGKYPVNGPLEIRVTGLDLPEYVGIPGAEAPSISPIRPVAGRPDLNTAVWFDILSLPGTQYLNSFMKDLENYFLGALNDGVNAVVRPEWSKGWAYTSQAGYANLTVINDIIPSLFNTADSDGDFAWTVRTLNNYDPARVFSDDFLNALLV